MIIDGTTEATESGVPGATMQITDGTPAFSGLVPLPYGIELAPGSDGSTIKGLELEGFTGGDGILIDSPDNTVTDNLIGTDVAGDNLGNLVGVAIEGGGIGNTIGGSTSGAGNTIGCNAAAAVSISGSTATGNLVEGNDIGTNSAASATWVMARASVLNDDPGNTIGGTTLGSANVIGFNAGAGVSITGSTGDLVWGNYIGTDEFNDKMGNDDRDRDRRVDR